MAIAVQVSGAPGTGKTFAFKTAAERYPKEIVYINADGKPLSWAGWRTTFNKENKNYFQTDDTSEIQRILIGVSEKLPHVKVVYIDTINTIMSNKEMRDRRKTTYDKWTDLAAEIFELYNLIPRLREDLIVIFSAHIEPFEAEGQTHYRTKTVGQKLTKLNLNSTLSYNLYTKVSEEGKDRVFSFVTQNNGRNEARSVFGVLPLEMPNDLGEVIHLIRTLDLGLEN